MVPSAARAATPDRERQAMTPILLLVATLAQAAKAPAAFPRFAPREPGEAAQTLRALHGFRTALIAAEPLVTDPVAAAYDEAGRLYVAEMNDYPHVDPGNDRAFADSTDPPAGRVRLLLDTDDDGRFDAGHVFAEGVSWPAGIASWKGGVYVAAAPDILYLKDTDGDGRADVRQRVFTGFRKYNVQALLNNLAWGLDHALYAAASGNGGSIRPGDALQAAPLVVQRRDFRFEPATGRCAAISGGARFGNSFDDWGNRFLCDIRNPAQHVVLPAEALARNPDLAAPRAVHDAALAGDALPVFRLSPPEPWREFRARRWAANGKPLPRSELVGAGVVTSSSGITVYRGDAYPPEYRGNLFLGEVAGNLVQRLLVRPDGVTFAAVRAEPDAEFLASTDTWFRAVNFVNAPDGTLHVLDMYRETIEHPWSIPDDIKARLDLRSGSDRGHLYRLEPPGFTRRKTPNLGLATTAELVARLDHPNAWHRDTAHRLLFERQDRAAVEPLRSRLKAAGGPLGALHALWSLDGLGALTEADLLGALAHDSAGIREHAVRLAEPRLADSPGLRERVRALCGDEAIRVRFAVALALGAISGPEVVEPLGEIARRDAGDVWVRTAVLAAASRCAPELFGRLVADEAFVGGEPGRAFLAGLTNLVGARGTTAEARAALAAMAGCRPLRDDPDAALSLMLDLGARPLARGQTLAALAGPEDAPAGALLRRLTDHARARLADPSATAEARARAAGLLAHRPAGEAVEALAPRLAPGEPPEVQRAAVEALSRLTDPRAASALLDAWPTLTPGLRAAALPALASRPSWAARLLDAVERGTVEPAQIPPAQRAVLASRAAPADRERAARLLAAKESGSRAEVVARYGAALSLPADAARGRAVFDRECATCHRLGDAGHAVGPNLASIGRRTPDEILLHVLDPNREVAPDYLEYAAELADGRVLSGVVAAESATSLQLVRAGGESATILRSELAALRGTGKSLMPDGLEARIPPDAMADLVAFLRELQK
jgi:putative membrane-bound dehydrogenase-like protein